MKSRVLASLFVASFAGAPPSSASIDPFSASATLCGLPTREMEAPRLFDKTSAFDPDCSLLAQATGLLGYDAEAAQHCIESIHGPLRQMPGWRWSSARIALARGDAASAFHALRPDSDGWPREPHQLWDLAVAAAVVGESLVADGAYRRLAQSDLPGERARLAMRLEAAAVESRLGESGVEAARQSLSSIAESETDPDTCPWVAAMLLFTERLAPRSKLQPPPSCLRAAVFSRLLSSSEGATTIFAAVPSSAAWLRLARNERLASVALALGNNAAALRRRLWTTVDAPAHSALSVLKAQELARLAAHGR